MKERKKGCKKSEEKRREGKNEKNLMNFVKYRYRRQFSKYTYITFYIVFDIVTIIATV